MNKKKEQTAPDRGIIIGTIILGAFISSMGQMVMTASLPSIMKDFGITAGVGQWLTTAYLLFLGIMIPLTGYLLDHFSVKSLYLFSIVMFLIGCIVAIFSVDFYMLLAARVIQAIGAGILIPTPQVVTFRLYEPDKRGVIMGIVGLTTGFGPVVGPTFSGWVVDNWGWHAIFYIMGFLSVICIILALIKLKSEEINAPGKLDILSVILSTIGFSGLLTGVTNQGNYGIGSMLTLLPFLAGLICLFLFVVRQLKIHNPLLELRVFSSRDFTFSTILLIFIYGSILTVSTLIPLYIQTIRGLTATVSGLVMLPGAIILAFLNPVTGKILDRKGPFMLSLGGLFLLAIGTLGIASMGEATSPFFAGFANSIQMLGIVALLQPLMTYAVNAVSTEYVSHATAIMNTARQIGGAILSAVFVTIMNTVSKTDGDLSGIRTAFFVIAIVVVISFAGVIFFMRPAKESGNPDRQQASWNNAGRNDNTGLVITIAREFGSGGHEIGKRVADSLGVKLYDSQLITMEAEQSGFSCEYITQHDEKLSPGSRLYDFAVKNYATYANTTSGSQKLSPMDMLFVVQSEIIQNAARKEPCVIVGRCADYVLRERKNCLNIFIHSDEKYKLQRIVEEYGIEETEAPHESKRKNQERSRYYEHYTGRKWGNSGSYHLILDSGTLGIDTAVEMILLAVRNVNLEMNLEI